MSEQERAIVEAACAWRDMNYYEAAEQIAAARRLVKAVDAYRAANAEEKTDGHRNE